MTTALLLLLAAMSLAGCASPMGPAIQPLGTSLTMAPMGRTRRWTWARQTPSLSCSTAEAATTPNTRGRGCQ
jgi:hypothetical protein